MTDFDPFLHGQRKLATKVHEKSAKSRDQLQKERRTRMEQEKERIDFIRKVQQETNKPKMIPAYKQSKQIIAAEEPRLEDDSFGKTVEPETKHIDVHVW